MQDMFERRGEKLSRMLKMNVLLMKNVLWRTDELDPTAIYCYGTFLMSLKNLVSGFCQTYSIGNTLAENNRCFRKKTPKNATPKHFFRGSPKQGHLRRRH